MLLSKKSIWKIWLSHIRFFCRCQNIVSSNATRKSIFETAKAKVVMTSRKDILKNWFVRCWWRQPSPAITHSICQCDEISSICRRITMLCCIFQKILKWLHLDCPHRHFQCPVQKSRIAFCSQKRSYTRFFFYTSLSWYYQIHSSCTIISIWQTLWTKVNHFVNTLRASAKVPVFKCARHPRRSIEANYTVNSLFYNFWCQTSFQTRWEPESRI